MALYGTLRPGGAAHFHVRDIPGTWSTGIVRGWTYDISWGPADGYPGITLDPGGNEIEVDVLESVRLASFWRRLDDYEGPGYVRVETRVASADGTSVSAWIYETVTDIDPG